MKPLLIALALSAISIWIGATIEPSVPQAKEGDPFNAVRDNAALTERGAE
jgi:hypothetical protein